MRSTGLFVLALAAVIPACGDDIKFPDQTVLPDPALNGVFPASGFTDRKIRVEISGDASEFSSGATVSFSGAGITVSNTAVASPSDLFVDITIAGDAAIGKRDVVVTDGGAMLNLAQAFEVKNPIEVLSTGGEVEQGGLSGLLIVNHDVEHPFSSFAQVTAGNGVSFLVDTTNSDAFNIIATGLYDTDATTGPLTITDVSGADTITSRSGDLVVAPRTATDLAPVVKGAFDLQATATLTHTTGLFKVPAIAFITGEVATTDPNPNAFPFMIFLEDGKWANRRGLTDILFDGDRIPAINMFVVILDDNGTSNYSYDLGIDFYQEFDNATLATEVEPNDDPVTAQDMTAKPQALITGASMASFDDNTGEGDLDVFKVHADAGQTIRGITTIGTSNFTDTLIDIVDSDGNLLAESNDFDLPDDTFQTDPVETTGDYFVVVSNSPFAFLVDHDPYELGIVVEDGLVEAFAPTQHHHLPFKAGVAHPATNHAFLARRSAK